MGIIWAVLVWPLKRRHEGHCLFPLCVQTVHNPVVIVGSPDDVLDSLSRASSNRPCGKGLGPGVGKPQLGASSLPPSGSVTLGSHLTSLNLFSDLPKGNERKCT